jgi:trans-AT polyketide synthase/acyltransferase/oxidoreductase domain-containing protein
MQADISAHSLGSPLFKRDYGLKYAYVTGSMYKGIASEGMVIRMGLAGMLGYLGSGGLKKTQVKGAIARIQDALGDEYAWGINLLSHSEVPSVEEEFVDLYIENGVRCIEASAFSDVSSAVARFRLTGLELSSQGNIITRNRVLAKVSRPEVAEAFLSPCPARLVDELLKRGCISPLQADLAQKVPVADTLCVEADSGGHTDQGVAFAIFPSITSLCKRLQRRFGYAQKPHLGLAGGIGDPLAAAAAFMMGADFILTGSINQCSVEAGTSDVVKDMLAEMDVQDTAYAPAGDMFEIGARVQVLRRGVFFPARANKLYDLYMRFNSLDDIDAETILQLELRYFGKTIQEIWEETSSYYARSHPEVLNAAEKNPKKKMALVFRWYFVHTSRLACSGVSEQKVNFQIHCGPALGAFNQWVKDSQLADWRMRHVDDIAIKLLDGTAEHIQRTVNEWENNRNEK